MIVAVTGASGGIGRAVGEALEARGDTVYDLSRRGGGKFRHLSCDVTDREAVFGCVAEILRESGRLDALVCNAGSGISGPIEETDPALARGQLEVLFFGVLNGVQAALPALRESRGAILLIGSISGVLPIPFQGFYSAGKAAVGSLASALRNEVRPFGVRIGALLPGDVKTGFTDRRRKQEDSALYGEAMRRAVGAMEKDERGGMDPARIGRRIAKLLHRRRLPLYSTVGAQYRLFLLLHRLLPSGLVCRVIGRMYG